MKELKKNSVSFLAIGKTQESSDVQEGFKRYLGYSNSYIVAVNPNKAELEQIYGRDIEKDPVYVGEDEKGKFDYIHFSVKTDPDDGKIVARDGSVIPGHGIETINRLMVTLRPTQAVTQDGTQVTVIDACGNYGRMSKEDAEAHKKPVSINGKDLRILPDYKIAFEGQDILTHILKTYLAMGNGFDYKNGTWIPKANPLEDEFRFEDVKKLFAGDASEIRTAISYQPNNKIKLLYGIRTADDGKQYQQVCSRDKFILRSNASNDKIAKMDADLQDAYNRGSFQNVEYKVQKLQEYDVEATNLDAAPAATSEGNDGKMPWD